MILFSPPVDFDLMVWQQYQTLDTVVQMGYVYDPGAITVWVCDPKADFVINKTVLESFPNLKLLATPSTGQNHISLPDCEVGGIKVLSLLDDRKRLNQISASSEFTFKLLLDALRMKPAHELQGKLVGLVGYGRIGHRLHDYLSPFGVSLSIHDPYARDTYSTPLEALFIKSDVVVICCELNQLTYGMITSQYLDMLKTGASLINTARAEIIDEADLYEFLQRRQDIRFVTDVVHGEVEGRAAESTQRILSTGTNRMVSPHIAGETFESRTKAAQIILDLLRKEYDVKPTETSGTGN